MGRFDRRPPARRAYGSESGGHSFGRRDFGGGRGFDRGGDRGGRGGDRPMHKAICSNCGKECEVPFRPTGEKPVYCSECFEKRNAGSQQRFDSRDRSPQPQNMAVLNAINAKLDRILKIVEPKAPETKAEEPKIVESEAADLVVEEVEPAKVKKTSKKASKKKK